MNKQIITIIALFISTSLWGQVDSSFFTIRLSSFDISVNNNFVQLHWKTACFLEYANFQIQKSTDGNNFTTIKSFVADRLRCQQPFDYNDSSNVFQGRVYYRINVGNLDGKFYHSAIRNVSIKTNSLNAIQVYPTITTNVLNFSFNSSIDATLVAVIINQSGNVVTHNKLIVSKGLGNYYFPINSLSSGFYWLQVLNAEGQGNAVYFIKH